MGIEELQKEQAKLERKVYGLQREKDDIVQDLNDELSAAKRKAERIIQAASLEKERLNTELRTLRGDHDPKVSSIIEQYSDESAVTGVGDVKTLQRQLVELSNELRLRAARIADLDNKLKHGEQSRVEISEAATAKYARMKSRLELALKEQSNKISRLESELNNVLSSSRAAPSEERTKMDLERSLRDAVGKAQELEESLMRERLEHERDEATAKKMFELELNNLKKERDLRKLQGSRKAEIETKDLRSEMKALQRALDGDEAGAIILLQERLADQRKEFEDEISRLINGHESGNSMLRSEYESKISELQKDMNDQAAINALKMREALKEQGRLSRYSTIGGIDKNQYETLVDKYERLKRERAAEGSGLPVISERERQLDEQLKAMKKDYKNVVPRRKFDAMQAEMGTRADKAEDRLAVQQENLENLTRKVTQLMDALAMEKGEREKAVRTINELELRLKKSEKLGQYGSEDYETLKNDMERKGKTLQDKLAVEEKAVSQLQDTLNLLETDVIPGEENVLINEYKKRIADLTKQLIQKERDFEGYNSRQLSGSNMKLQAQERQIQRYKDELAKERSKYDSEGDRFMETVKDQQDHFMVSQRDLMESKDRALRSSKEQIDDLNEQNDGLRDRIHSLEDEITEARRRVMRDADDHIDAVTALEQKARADREMMAQRLREAEGERDIVLKSHGQALQNMGLDDDFVTDLGLKDEDDLDSLRAKAHALAVECKLRQSRLDDSEAQKTILSSRVLDLEESLTKLQEKK